ncbi:radical SAM protein [Candidatus Woesearchaeota archaeon]|nr:radical SAM protein [Candidatus Woesearchaeota archaeon]
METSTLETKEITAKSILVPSKLPGCDFVINCYTGCRFGCSYCYASFMGRFVDKKISDWGNYVYAKINAPDLLKKDLIKLKNKGKGKTILLSSVTDPFQGAEAKYHLSAKCLEILADYGFEGEVSILTKSPLVLNVLPILKRLKNVDVGLTITSTDDKISRYFEKFAPNVSQRLETLKKLNEEGIKTYAFFGPLLPHFVANKEEIKKVLDAIHQTGTRQLFVEHINLSKYIKDRMLEELKDIDKSFLEQFYSSQSKDYRSELNKLILDLLKEYDFELLHEIIFHKEMMS